MISLSKKNKDKDTGEKGKKKLKPLLFSHLLI